MATYKSLTNVASRLLFNEFVKPPDIICMQETRITEEREKGVLAVLQYDTAFAPSDDKAVGLLTGFKRQLDYVVHNHTAVTMAASDDCVSQCLLVHCTVQEQEMVIINVYCHTRTTDEKRVEFFTEVGERLTEYGCPNIVCCGDFNTVIDPNLDTTTARWGKPNPGAR